MSSAVHESAVVRMECPQFASNDDTSDALDSARRVIDAAAAWDMDALCELIGRADVPEGLGHYYAAIRNGLSTDAELVRRRDAPDNRTTDLLFEIPARGGKARLGLFFQRQSGGWVLLTALFLQLD